MIEDYFSHNDQPLSMSSFLHATECQSAPTDIQKALDFLRTRFDFIYTDNLYQAYPFSPMAIFDGKRSKLPSDLSSDDLQYALSIISFTESHALRAKLWDVIGYCKKDKNLILQAAEEYYLNFQEHVSGGHSYNYISPLKRSLYLFCKNGQKKKMEQYLDELIENNRYAKDTQLVIVHFLSEFVPHFSKNKLSKTLVKVKEVINDNFDEPISLDIIDSLLVHISPQEKQEWISSYVGIAKKVAIRMSPHGYRYLERAASYVDKDSDLFSELKFLSEEEQKKLYLSMDMRPFSIKLEKGIIDQFEMYRKTNIETLKSLPDGASQIIWLLAYFKPYAIDDIESSYTKEKNSIRYLVNNINFNSDGIIEFESSIATEADKKERIIADIYNLHTEIICPLVLWPFANTLKNDASLEELILEIVNHNVFIPQERRSVVQEKIMGGFNRNIGDALIYLIPQLEFGFLTYIKERKHIFPEYQGKTINLNNMLVQKGNSPNRFRSALLDIVDPSLLQHLEYRLCRKFGGNFRNRDFHTGVLSTTQFTFQEAETLYLIFLVYCQGYDNEV